MAKVSSPFIAPVHGVSQQDPTLVPEGYLKEQVNMISDAIKGLYRRPGTELIRLYTEYPKVFIKVIEHNQVDYEIFLARDATLAQWYLKITQVDTGAVVGSQTITDVNLVAYLDTLQDDNDLLLKDYQNNLYVVSKKQNIIFEQEGSNITITFEGIGGKILGSPGYFSITIGELEGVVQQLEVNINSSIISSSAADILNAFKTAFETQIGSYLFEPITTNPTLYQLSLTFKSNIVVDLAYTQVEEQYKLNFLFPKNANDYSFTQAYFTLNCNTTLVSEVLFTIWYVVKDVNYELVVQGTTFNSFEDIRRYIESKFYSQSGIIVKAIITNLNPFSLKLMLPIDFQELTIFLAWAGANIMYGTLVDAVSTTSYEFITGNQKSLYWKPIRKIKLEIEDKTIAGSTYRYMPKIWIDVHKIGLTPLEQQLDDILPGEYRTIIEIMNSLDQEIDTYTLSIGMNSSQLYAIAYSTYLEVFIIHGYEISFKFEEAPLMTIDNIYNGTLKATVDFNSYPIRYNWILANLEKFQLDLFSNTSDAFFLLSYISNSPIVDLMFYQNRLVFITERALLASRVGRFSQFYPDNPDVLLESDPILLLIAQAGDKLQAMIPFSESILLMGNREQYTLYHQGFMTFSNLTLLPATSYTLGPAKPIKAGSEVFFSNNNQNFSRVLKYIVQPNTQIKSAYELTMNVTKYIPKNVEKMIYLDSLDMLIVFTKESPNTLYVLNQAYSGDQQVQLAWHKWTFSYPIVNIEKDSRDLLYIFFDLTSNVAVTKLDLISERPKFYLDLWETSTISFSDPNRVYVLKDVDGNYLEGTSDNYTYTGLPFESYIELFPWILKNSSGQPMTDGRLQLKQLELIFTDTWYLKVVNTPLGRPEYIREYQNLTLDGYEIPGGYDQDILNSIKESRGTLKTYIGGQADKSNLKITSGDSMWKMGIIGYTLYGNWQPYSKWSHGSRMGGA